MDVQANTEAVQALQSCAREAQSGITNGADNLPHWILKVFKLRAWEAYKAAGEVRHFDSPREFFESNPPGLKLALDELRQHVLLSRREPTKRKALELLDRISQRAPGRPTETFDNVKGSEAPTGNARQHALRALRTHRPDLLERVLADELTPHAAMVEAGLRRQVVQLHGGSDPGTVAERIRERCGAEFAAALAEALATR